MPHDLGTTRRKAMSKSRRLRIWEAHRGVCCLCGRPIDGVREKWIVEHIRALELGGADTDANCGPAHEACAKPKTKDDHSRAATAKRQKQRQLGIKSESRRPMPCGKNSPFKRTMDGRVVRRDGK